jgi:hypothetical protein
MLSPHFRLLPVPGPSTARGSHLSPYLPLLPADSSFQVFAESKTLRFLPVCHSRLCAGKIGAHLNNIHPAIPVDLCEFSSERSPASAQRLDLPGQSSHVLQQSAHTGPPCIFPAIHLSAHCQAEGHTMAPHLTVVGLQPSIRQEPQHWLSDR